MEPITLTLLVLSAAVVLFATELLPIDLTALCVLVSLMVLGLVEPAEAVSGFSNPATVTVASMLVLSGGLQRTGAMSWFARMLAQALEKGGEIRLLVFMVIILGPLSAFINNTAVAAVFLPVLLGICRDRDLSPSKFLIPLSYFSIFGGVCTLIGTSTNILVSELMGQHDLPRLSMFEMTPVGAVLAVAGALYMILVGRHIIPDRMRRDELVDEYRLKHYMTEAIVLPGSPLAGTTLRDSGLRENFDLDILEIIRGGVRDWLPLPDRTLAEGDILLVRGRVDTLMRIKEVEGLAIKSTMKHDHDLTDEDVGLAEAIVAPRSHLVDRTLKEVNFRNRYGVTALAIQRHGGLLRDKVAYIRLQVGDSLLLQGNREQMGLLREEPDFLLVEDVTPTMPRRRKVPLALGIVAGVVLCAALGVAPIMLLAVTGAVLMVLSGCLQLQEAYESLDLRVIFLLAGAIPLGLAMENTGTAQFLADHLTGLLADFGPLVVMIGLYLLTMLLTECMSNAASSVLLVPIAFAVAKEIQVDPRPLMMSVAFAASTSFMTPVGYQTNTFVYAPGNYRFLDFTRVGLPLSLIFLTLATILIPLQWPFHPAPESTRQEGVMGGAEGPISPAVLTLGPVGASIHETPVLDRLQGISKALSSTRHTRGGRWRPQDVAGSAPTEHQSFIRPGTSCRGERENPRQGTLGSEQLSKEQEERPAAQRRQGRRWLRQRRPRADLEGLRLSPPG